MTTLIKKSKAGIKISSRRTNSKTEKISEKEISNSITDLLSKQVDKKVAQIVKTVNKYWMRDLVEQLNFLKADQKISALIKNNQEDFFYYVDFIETV